MSQKEQKVSYEIKWEAPLEVYMTGAFPTAQAAVKRISELPEAIEQHLLESGRVKLTITLELKERG